MCKKYKVYTMAELTMQTMTMYNRINKKWFGGELPKAVITYESGKGKAYGWTFTNKKWVQGKEHKYAIMLASEIIGDIRQMMITLTHEMCHIYAMEKGIAEVSRGGYYHNKEFAKIAEMAGLVVTQEKQGAATRSYTEEYAKWLESECCIDEIRIKWKEQIQTAKPKAGEKEGESQEPEGEGKPRKKSGYFVFKCPKCGKTARTSTPLMIACMGIIGMNEKTNKPHEPAVMLIEN